MEEGGPLTSGTRLSRDRTFPRGRQVRQPTMGQTVVIPEWAGYVACIYAGVAFGSNFVPVKQYDAKDGVFFQWVLCIAIWMCGFVVNIIRSFPPFQPFAMLGGFLWATGNMMAVPIIQCIGLSLGLLLWGLTGLLMGWCTGSFGWFGLKSEVAHIPWLNYTGAAFAVLSGILFAFITPSEKKEEDEDETAEAFLQPASLINDLSMTTDPDESEWSIANWSATQKRVVGVVLSIISGLLYGSNFTPPQYIIDHCNNSHYDGFGATNQSTCSKDGLDYVFSHFTGIFITSTFYFLAYAVFKKNKPVIIPEIILPGFASGLMWASAQIAFFIANATVELVVSFPVISTLPGIVGSLWGILVFREITGMKNYLFFTAAFFCVGACVTMVALSKTLPAPEPAPKWETL